MGISVAPAFGTFLQSTPPILKQPLKPSDSSLRMLTYSLQLALLAAAYVIVACQAHPFGAPQKGQCHDMMIPIKATSHNRYIADAPLNNDTAVPYFVSVQSETAPKYVDITDSYNISARFCEPTVLLPSRASTIQLLVHGATYNKAYWSALDSPNVDTNQYSWVNFAQRQGFATLSIDRAGYGNSSHPDPFTTVQVQTQTAIIRQLIQNLRSGTIGNRKFDKVVYVGHSFGSIIGNALTITSPSSADAVILTGFASSTNLNPDLATYLRPAALFEAFPRFHGLSTGYLSNFNSDSRTAVMYGPEGTYDPRIPAIDFALEDTTTIGELSTPTTGVAQGFTGDVAVITGKQDAAFCYQKNSTADCGEGTSSLPALVKQFYPKARTFDFYVPDQMGHDCNFHYRAPAVFGFAHAWLTNNKY